MKIPSVQTLAKISTGIAFAIVGTHYAMTSKVIYELKKKPFYTQSINLVKENQGKY